ncbi:diguanylate cyclase [bacterium]|nr:diguanylate cyclase [bacterium]
MHAKWTLLLVILLFSSCSSQDNSDGDRSENSDDRAMEMSVGEKDTSLQLRYTSGITAIYEDSKGRFWFGSQNEGVCMYDGSGFTYYTMSDGLSNNQVRSIQEDRDGVIWFGTANGITSFDGEKLEIRTGGNHGIPDPVSGNTWQMASDDLWFLGDSGMHAGYSDGQGTYRYDGRSLTYLSFPLPPGAKRDDSYLVTGIVKGRNGTVWFATYPAVFGYDGQSFTIINDKTAGTGSGAERLHVRSIFEDSRGHLWIGNNGLGVLHYDGETVTNFTEQQGLSLREKGPTGSLGRIFSIAEDAAGNIWFGSRDNGAWRYDGTSLTNFTMKDGLTSSMVWTIYRDSKDVLWFGMADGSVCRFDGEGFDRTY